MRLGEIIRHLEDLVPPALQEGYDNSGIQCGEMDQEVSSILICLDITGEVLEEALRHDCSLIVSHHPLIFQPLNSLTGDTAAGRILRKAVQNNIALYAAHTNLDKVAGGVSFELAGVLGLKELSVLAPEPESLFKLVTFVPEQYLEDLRAAVFAAGAGTIGDYDHCGYHLSGTGTFRAGEDTNPFAGKKGKDHFEAEIRFETIFPGYLRSRVLKALLQSHPYEEAAYDLYPLANENPRAGLGAIGILEHEHTPAGFLKVLQDKLQARGIRYTDYPDIIRTVAVCGGSGFSLWKHARAKGADAFVTADVKYHQFAEPEGKMMLIDAGHYETEQFTKDVLYRLLTEKFPNFAVRFSSVNTNPINYY